MNEKITILKKGIFKQSGRETIDNDLRKIEKSPASVGRKFFIVIIWNIYHPNSSYFPLFIHHST